VLIERIHISVIIFKNRQKVNALFMILKYINSRIDSILFERM